MRRTIARITVAAAGLASAAALSSYAPSMAAGESCEGQAATIVGTEDGDELVGTPGPDVVVGLGGNDHIDTLGGQDVICAGDGDDTVSAGVGEDRVEGGAGEDRIDLGTRTDVAVWRVGDGTDLVLGGPRRDDLFEMFGTPGDDAFSARTTHDEVGRALAVTVAGGGATLHKVEAVTVWMGDGADTFTAGRTRLSPTQFYTLHTDEEGSEGGADLLVWRGYRGADDVSLNAGKWEGSDTSLQAASPRGARFFTLASSDPEDSISVDGRAGRDSVTYVGAAGANHVEVSGSTSRAVRILDRPADNGSGDPVRAFRVWAPERLAVYTQTGQDEIDLRQLHSSYPVRVFGGTRRDVFLGSDGPDLFNGGFDADVAHGAGGDDVLLGRFDDDALFGGPGDDRLNGGPNDDACDGGPGKDRLLACE